MAVPSESKPVLPIQNATLLPSEYPGVLGPCRSATVIYGLPEFSDHSAGSGRSQPVSSPFIGPASHTSRGDTSQVANPDVFFSGQGDAQAEGKEHIETTAEGQPPRTIMHRSKTCSKFIPLLAFPVEKEFTLSYPPNVESAMLAELNAKAPMTKKDLTFWGHSINHDYSVAASMGISITAYRTGRQLLLTEKNPLLGKMLSSLSEPALPVRSVPSSSKVAKADDALIATHFWDQRVIAQFSHLQGPSQQWSSSEVTKALSILREKFLLPRFRLNIWKSFRRYAWRQINARPTNAGRIEFAKDCQCLRKILLKVLGGWLDSNHCLNPGCSWWELTTGSALFFWRWHKEIRNEARDGLHVHIVDPLTLPHSKLPQRLPKTEAGRILCAKVSKPVNKGYIEPGFVHNLSQYFPVPKVKEFFSGQEVVTDWRVVYDFTKSCLNDHIWSPNYPLPTQEAVLRQTDHASFLGDIDEGEQFLNFPLDPRLRPYAGVDLTPIIKLQPDSLAALWTIPYIQAAASCPDSCKRCWGR